MYLMKGRGLTAENIEKFENKEPKMYIQHCNLAILQLLQHIMAVDEKACSPGYNESDIMKIVSVQNTVARAQAIFRASITRKKMDKDATTQLRKLEIKKRQNIQSKEEIAMKEFTQRLTKKTGLTPEGFFRAVDVNYHKSVPCNTLKIELEKQDLKLSKPQLSRLLLILDEDMEGNITLAEYQNALEVYGCSGETHYDPEGSSQYYIFDHRAIFKLLKILEHRSISATEFFNSCDADHSCQVQVSEFEDQLFSLSSEFTQKEIHAIYKYFDVNKDGICQENEYTAQMKKAQKLYEAYLEQNKGS